MANQVTTLDTFFAQVQHDAGLRTPAHADLWTEAVLRTLGFTLKGGAKRELAKALPDELAAELKRGWRLINFRDPNLTEEEFVKQVAYRSGNTDGIYSRIATSAVFRNLKTLISTEVNDSVVDDLPPEVAQLWKEA